MKHRDLVNWLRYRTRFLSPINDFEIAMIVDDVKFLPGRITGYRTEPAMVEHVRIELTSTDDINWDTGQPTRSHPIY